MVTSELTRPAGIVFDNDGLLLDTEPCWTLAQEELFRSYDQKFTLADKQALIGTSPRTAAPILARLLPGTEPGERLSEQMYALALAEIADGAEPRPGAVALIGAVRAAGLPVAVASNSPRRHLLAGLRRAGLAAAFGVVLGVDEVAEPKPAPDLYLTACARLGAAPGESVALEDSPPGVAAARGAGLRVIGIPSIEGVVLTADVLAASLGDAAVYRALGLEPTGAGAGRPS